MSLDEFRTVRIEKLKRLRKAGIDPYPTTSRRTHAVSEVLGQFDALASSHSPVTVAGRALAIRTHGGITFVDVHDGSGALQALLKEDAVGADAYRLFVDAADIGDFVEFDGPVFTTKRGEKTLVEQVALAVFGGGNQVYFHTQHFP